MDPPLRIPRFSPRWLAILAGLLFIPGLGGPFLLDDWPNLEPIQAWAEGRVDLAYVLDQARAGPLGRPLSLLSFALTAATTGFAPLGFKATNLLLHLLNGLLAGAFLERCLRRMPNVSSRPRMAAWIAAAVWIALPLHVPTVLYAVQRMTLLSATFALLALLAWMTARDRLDRDARNNAGLALMWLGVPILTLISALAKESGFLAPLLCGVLEFTLFAPRSARPRPAAVTWFVRALVFAPITFGALYLATHPAYVLGGYENRPFGLAERLMSQPRALWEYAWLTVAPSAGKLGLYQDTFAVSRNWMTPLSTLPALLGWLLVAGVAFARKRQYPGIAAGVFFFLAGHVMESTVFALELFFIHRNYLPSLGIVLAISTALILLGKNAGPRVAKLLPVLVGLVISALAVTTATRAWVWGDETRLLVHELHINPDSLRLRSDLAARAIAANRLDIALRHLSAAEAVAPPEERRAVRLWRVLAYCSNADRVPSEVLDSLRDGESHRITPYTMRALTLLATHREAGSCPELQAHEVADAVVGWLHTVPRPPSDPTVWRSRYAAARLYASNGDLDVAQATALRAFQDSRHAFPIGVLAFQLSSSLGDHEAQRRVYGALRSAHQSGDPREELTLKSFAVSMGKCNDHQ